MSQQRSGKKMIQDLSAYHYDKTIVLRIEDGNSASLKLADSMGLQRHSTLCYLGI